MPIYVPREIIHAAGMLPVGILGGGDQIEVIQGDAYYQSYICRIPRSTIELGLTGRLDCLDGMLFPSICDVIRNLSGMWQILFKDKYVRYFDVPQNYEDAIGGRYYVHELEILRDDLGRLRGAALEEQRHDLDDAEILFQNARLEPRVRPPAVCRLVRIGLDGSGQEPPTEWGVGDEGDVIVGAGIALKYGILEKVTYDPKSCSVKKSSIIGISPGKIKTGATCTGREDRQLHLPQYLFTGKG